MGMLKRYLINRRLKATMKPDPEYRERRLAQFNKERQMRYWLNASAVYGG